MDLFCNQGLVGKSFKVISGMHLQSNSGTMMVMQQVHVPGNHKPVWFKKSMIINIITLNNLIQQYHVTYDSINETFMVHRESHSKPNMQF
jgi:hypothetical protein